jgi:hypothetical protein
LVAEGSGVGESLLGSKAAEEGEAERGQLGEGLIAFEWVEVQQVGFYGEGVAAEGWAVADVGDGLEGFGD